MRSKSLKSLILPAVVTGFGFATSSNQAATSSSAAAPTKLAVSEVDLVCREVVEEVGDAHEVGSAMSDVHGACSGGEQLANDLRTDEARSTGDQDRHMALRYQLVVAACWPPLA